MSKALRSLAVTVLIVGFSLLAVGCSASEPAPAQSTKPSGEAKPQQAAAAQPAPAQPKEEDLIAAAKKEGAVNLYTAQNVFLMQNLAKKFEEKYGIKVDVTRTGGEQLAQRFMQEYDTGVNRTDVFHSSNEALFLDMKESNRFAPYIQPGQDKIKDSYRDKDHYWYTTHIVIYGMGYNTKLIPSDQRPKSWKEALDPKWKGKIVQSDPNYSGASAQFVQILGRSIGYDFFAQMAKLDPLTVEANGAVGPAVVSGERPLGVGLGEHHVVEPRGKGDPIDFIFPEDGSIVMGYPVAVAAKAPHPNAARLLSNYMMSQEGQQICVDYGFASVRTDVKYAAGRDFFATGFKQFYMGGDELRKGDKEAKDKWRQAMGL